jgi:hypothetical protein
LLAAWYNNVGTGIISVGVVSPLAARILGVSAGATADTIVLLMAFSSVTGFAFHLIGALFLLRYEP